MANVDERVLPVKRIRREFTGEKQSIRARSSGFADQVLALSEVVG